jgi:hypothetical protein
LCTLLAIAGCGGGGSSSAAGLGGSTGTDPGTPPPSNPPPGVVDNGVPAVVTSGTKLVSTVSSDLSTSVATDPAGNVFSVGQTWGGLDNVTNGVKTGTFVNADTVSPGYTSDAFLIKYTPAGTIAWTRQFGSIEGDYATGVSADRLGNVFVVGYTYGAFDGETHPGGKAMFVAKYSPAGARLWTRIYGSGTEDEATGVTTDRFGNAFVAGRTRSGMSLAGAAPYDLSINPTVDNNDYTGWETIGSFDGFAARYDTDGNLVWTTLFGKSFDDSVLGIAADEIGNVSVTGYVTLDVNYFLDKFVRRVYFSNALVPFSFVAQLDPATGAVNWDYVTSEIGGPDHQDDPAAGTGELVRHLYHQNFMTSIGIDREGGTYQGGYIVENHDGNTSNAGDVYFKLTRRFISGNLNWHSYAPGTTAGDQVRGLTVDRGGDVYMTGYVAGNFDGNGRVGGTDVILMQFDGTSGSKIRTLQIGTVTEDKAMGIASDGSGNLFVAGFTYGSFGGATNAGGYDAFVLKFNQQLQRL